MGFGLVGIQKCKELQPTTFLSCALNTYGTLSMFLLSVQNNFYIILSSYVERHAKQNSSLNFMSLVGFQASEIWIFFFFGKLTAQQVLKSFSDRKNFLKPPVFWFSNRLPHRLVESRELRALISWVLGL